MPPKTEIVITLAAEEWNVVLETLADGRHRIVSPVIAKIVEQAQAQQTAQVEPERAIPRLHPAG